MDKPMQQQYHVVVKKKVTTIRRPWKGATEELYSSSGRFNDKGDLVSPAMFGKHEVRQFLEDLGPFSIMSVDDPGAVRQYFEEGYTIVDPDTKVKSSWYVAGYFVRDEGTTLIMLPKETTDAQFFGHLKLRVDLENKWSNSFKVGKYMKRLFSHHRQILRGTVVSKGDGDVIIVKLDNGKAISVRYANHDIVDGMNLVSIHCMKMMGLKGKIGSGLRITALSPKGFSKGHAIVLDGLKYDLVLFNSKKMLFGERFFFAVDWLHTGRLFTDVQSVTNFQMDDTSFLLDWSFKYMGEVMEALADKDKLRKMLGFYKREFHVYDRGENEGEFIDKDKDWSLLRAMRGGVDHVQHPALMLKMFRLFMDNIMNCEGNIRVPVPPEDGGARYALIDPTVFDANGDPTLPGQLSGNTVHCEAFSGDIVFHRQPNGHRGEHWIATAVPNLLLENMDRGCFIFMSRDMVEKSLKTLGGGDQDDRLVYYKNQQVVEHFVMLDHYPVVPQLPKPVVERKENPFGKYLRQPKYDRTQLLVMLDMMEKQRVHIGQAVNPLLHDASISDHKQELIACLTEMIKTDPSAKNKAALQWVIDYKPNQLNELASNLELFIDSVKKDGGDMSKWNQVVKDYNNGLKVVCEFNTRGGKYHGRVPSSRRNDNHPVIAKCNIDKVLDQIKERRQQLEEAVIDLSWQKMEHLPPEIMTVKTYPGSDTLARQVKQTWGALWAEARKDIPATGDHDDDHKKAVIKHYKAIDEKLYQMFGQHPLIVDAFVHLYQRVYCVRAPEAPRDENGKPEKYRDAILWGPRMSRFTIKALEMCGLAGRYVQIPETNWYTKHDRKEFSKKDVDVTIQKDVVEITGTGRQIAMVETQDGNRKLEHGWLYEEARNAYPYEPAPKLGLYVVVNGMQERGVQPEELLLWKSHVHEHVTLVPATWEGGHAVKVMLDDNTQHGWLTRKENSEVTSVTEGWLMPGDKHTMMVLVSDNKE